VLRRKAAKLSGNSHSPWGLTRACGKKFFLGAGCGVWGVFTDFEGVNYLIFREEVPEFSPRSPQWLALFEGKKV
jgi:hypothetical protein